MSPILKADEDDFALSYPVKYRPLHDLYVPVKNTQRRHCHHGNSDCHQHDIDSIMDQCTTAGVDHLTVNSRKGQLIDCQLLWFLGNFVRIRKEFSMLDFVGRFATELDTESMTSHIERFNVTLEVSFTSDDRIYGAYLEMNGANDHGQNVQEMLNITEEMRK